jgi:hypothetical protein
LISDESPRIARGVGFEYIPYTLGFILYNYLIEIFNFYNVTMKGWNFNPLLAFTGL